MKSLIFTDKYRHKTVEEAKEVFILAIEAGFL